jgi:hypothetical protein
MAVEASGGSTVSALMVMRLAFWISTTPQDISGVLQWHCLTGIALMRCDGLSDGVLCSGMVIIRLCLILCLC